MYVLVAIRSTESPC